MSQKVFEGIDTREMISVGTAGIDEFLLNEAPKGTPPRPSDVPELGSADNRIKRLYLFGQELEEDIESLDGQIKSVIAHIMSPVSDDSGPRRAGDALIALCDGRMADHARHVAELEAQYNEKVDLRKVVINEFWAEVKRRNPELRGWKKITIHDDWSFTASNDTTDDLKAQADKLADKLEKIFGGKGRGAGGLDDLMSELKKNGFDVVGLGMGEDPSDFSPGSLAGMFRRRNANGDARRDRTYG